MAQHKPTNITSTSSTPFTATAASQRKPQPSRSRKTKSSISTRKPKPKLPRPRTPSIVTLPASASTLSRIESLLHQLHRRNKNQHHSQKWYKHLSLVRKAVRLLLDIESREVSLKLTKGTSGKAEDVRKRFENETELRRQKEQLSEWVREVVVPGAYIAFSSVVKDSQFSVLGVGLLGILSDVVGVVGVPTRRLEQRMLQEQVTSVVGWSVRVTGNESGMVEEHVYDSDDIGEVVDRMKGPSLQWATRATDVEDLGERFARQDVQMEDPPPQVLEVDSPSAVDSMTTKVKVMPAGAAEEDSTTPASKPTAAAERLQVKPESKTTKGLTNSTPIAGKMRKKPKKKNAIDELFGDWA